MNPEQQDIIMNEPTETGQITVDETTNSVVGSTTGSFSGIKTPNSSCPESAIERLQARIKDARKELENIYIGDAACPEETLEAADRISKRISSYETHLSALTDKAEKQLRPVNLRDIPRFQIVGQTKHYEGYPSYSSLEHFFSSFETVMHASSNDVEQVWKQYIPVSMHFTYKTWVNNDLLKCSNWESAKALFVKHYGVPVNSMDLISKLFNMRMKTSDTLQNYTNRFMKNVQEAGFPLESNTLAKFYQCSLLKKNQQMMVNQMLVKRDSNHRWTINEIYECVLPLFLADEQARGESEVVDLKGKRKADAAGISQSKNTKMASTGYFCPKHGGNAANHNTADCKSRLKQFGSENKPNRATTAAPRTVNSLPSGPKTCNFCNKPRAYGHRCQEFYDWKKERESRRNIEVHTVKTTVPEDNKSGSGSGSGSVTNDATIESGTDSDIGDAIGDVTMEEIDACLDEIEAEDASLNCKSNVKNVPESFNPFQLLTPIILESKEGKPVRLIAKVDTGSDSTFLNKNIFHNKLLFTSQDIISVEGNLNFLSHSVKRLGKTPAIKIRYLNDIAFDHSFELSNFIQDLGDFDVLLGVDTLSRLRIGLTGVAHKFADIGHLTEEEKSELLESIDFENVNFDTKHSIDPETASIFESQAEENKYMSNIQDAIDENQRIKPGTFCNVPESEITIPIKENVDYYVKQYPIAHHAMPEIEKQLNEWLDAGIVEQCRPNGLFNSPLIAVSKKDSDGKPTKTRVCMDVRRINQHMPNNTNQFEIPNIQDIFTRIKQKGTIFSKIDLKNAYFSFRISDISRNVLLFNFRGKSYRWLGCCFGLRPITSVFSSVMNILFSDMPNVEVYVDDLCLVSSSLSSHCELIKEVLRRLTHANLKIGVEKCSWFRSSIYLLGFVVGPHVSKVDMRRLSDIDHWGPCKSAKQVKQLAGVISYLRPHIPNLSKLMAPIDALRNDPDAGSKWTDEHTKRLEIIKKVLLSEALLTAPDMNKKFYLECDASLYAVAVILTQRDDQGRTVYVAMLSKSLTKSQQNWPVLRRELYAVLFGLVRLRPLLYGHPEIEVMTDHRALIYIYTCKCPTRVIQNYMEILNEYPQLQFTHIKGLDNILPDKLSRLYEPLEDHTELAGDSDKKIAKLQKNIMRSKGSKKRFIGNNKQTKHYLTKNKVVYNKDKHLNVLAMKIKEGNYESVAYIAPPDNERDQLLRETHEFGHFGAASIVKKLHEEGIHWTGLYDDAKAICQSCMECARHNVVQKGYHELRNVVAYGPFDHIGIDFLGPLTPTNNGNIYILVVYDICTRFIITRALPNKQTDTVARALTTIFGDFGVVQILQSDNGREFKSALMSEIGKALGINQRYSTAFHARGNGASESGVKNILNALRKMVSEHIYDWDSVLPGTQLAINTKIRYRTESAPFQLMFARPLNRFVDYDDPKIKDNLPKKPMTLGELRKKAEIMNQVVFPAINQRTQRIIEEQATRFNKHHKITHFKVGDWVMVRLPHRESKLEAAYDGPYQVVQKKRSTYVLKDDMNELLHRDYVPSELKLVAIDESIIEQEVYEVDEIRAHRGPEHNREYLVKWKTFGEASNSWETAASFNNPQTIRKYWAKIKEYELLEKRRQALNSDTASSKSKRKRDDSDKRLRGSKRLNVAEQ
ncbi:SNARE-binding exocyst subunit S6 [Mucor velutinosus]|uniref:RNA-directed DNA polymerase n=1 Tax=Mucor velutinosus TaxID=708070 RepID=A0AAN7DB53_9FUNG|nr:SNARE-binding exocyst subunit S6 [Mucor velutinosus]